MVELKPFHPWRGVGAGQEQYHQNIVKEVSIAAACVDEGGGDQGPCFLIIPRGCVSGLTQTLPCLAGAGEGPR